MKRHPRPERRDGDHLPIARELNFKEAGKWIDRASRDTMMRAAEIQRRGADFGPEELELATFMIEHSATMARVI
jgi:hypothetical protein